MDNQGSAYPVLTDLQAAPRPQQPLRVSGRCRDGQCDICIDHTCNHCH